MKKIILISTMVSLVILLVVGLGNADTFVITDTYLGDTTNFVDKDGTSSPDATITYNSRTNIAGDPGYEFSFTMNAHDPDATPTPGNPWGDKQVGDNFDHPGDNSGVVVGGGNLSTYDTYQMSFHNPNDSDWFMVNIYMNTGWTDAPWSETDNFYENTWTWVAPGQTVTLTIDLTGVVNLNHVSDIGFKVGSNYGDGDYLASGSFDVQVVPLPPSVLLLGSGLLGLSLLGFRRRRD
jgi:hypothetical protein